MTTCTCDPTHVEAGGYDSTCPRHNPVELTPTEVETLVEPVYDAYRLGSYSSQEYLPMWHELTTKPVGTPEALSLLDRVRAIVVKRTAQAETERDMLHARIHRLAKAGCGATSAELWNIIREPRR